MRADAWFLYEADDDKKSSAQLVRETFEVPRLEEGQVLAEPLFGCWEANMTHALQRDPVDVCRLRKEPRIVLGNAGVVRILEVGRNVKGVRPGQNAIIFCVGEEDWFGYPTKILGYDSPGTMGCLSTKMVIQERQLIPIPANTKHELTQWAGFSLRYITAWSNWELAYGTYRLQVSADELAAINVWGWGGGTSFAELQLARLAGCKASMISGNPKRREAIAKVGVTPIDRAKLADLNFDPHLYDSDPGYKSRYLTAEKTFIDMVREHTDHRMVQIFLDFIGLPVYRATLKALAREGIISTAGWKEGMNLSIVRAIECINRHQHIHTHYARYEQGWKAVAFAEPNGWLPPKPRKIYSFDEIPSLQEDYAKNKTDLFPIFSISND